MRFHGDVNKAHVLGQHILIEVRRLRFVADDRNDGGIDAGADRPDMQVRDDRVGVAFNGVVDGVADRVRRLAIDQNYAGLTQQGPGPTGNENGAGDAHERVHPHESVELSGQQRADGQHGGQGIRHDVHVGGPEIVVRVAVLMGVRMVMVVAMSVSVSAQDGHADAIDDQPENRDPDGLIEGDGHGREKARDALDRHPNGEADQQDSTGESGQGVDLPGSEAEAPIVRQPPRQNIGNQRDAECDRVRRHVQSVRQESHGAEQAACGNFHDHECAGQGDHDDRPALSGFLMLLPEAVVMLPLRDGVAFRVHGEDPFRMSLRKVRL